MCATGRAGATRGCCPAVCGRVRPRSPVPSGRTSAMPSLLKAIHLPSGDQAGAEPPVIMRGADPFERDTKSVVEPESLSWAYASCRPFGLQFGWYETSEKGSTPTCGKRNGSFASRPPRVTAMMPPQHPWATSKLAKATRRAVGGRGRVAGEIPATPSGEDDGVSAVIADRPQRAVLAVRPREVERPAVGRPRWVVIHEQSQRARFRPRPGQSPLRRPVAAHDPDRTTADEGDPPPVRRHSGLGRIAHEQPQV